MEQSEAYPYEEIVAVVLKILAGLEYSLAEQARACGICSPSADTQDSLLHELVQMDHRGGFARFEIIVTIVVRVANLFMEDRDAMMRWITVRHPSYGNESVKSLMISGDFDKLQEALEIVVEAERA